MIPGTFAALRTWASLARTTVSHLVPANAIAPFDRMRAWKLQRRWAVEALDRLGIEVRVHHPYDVLTASRGALLVHLNQQTLLAPLLYAVGLPPCRIVHNFEYAALPLVGWLAVATGGTTIVRQRPAQAKAALATVARRLRAGETYGISIEGRRSPDGELQPFKKGPAVLALEAQCDIIPFMTLGEYACWPRGEWRIRPGRVDFHIYPPISTRGLGYEARDRLVAELRALAEREHARHRAHTSP